MAPTNDMNGPAIAFLTLSFVFLLLLMLIWYRYLIWWNRKGGQEQFEQKRLSERGFTTDPGRPPKNRRPRKDRRHRGPRSLSPINAVHRMAGQFPQGYRVQPPAGTTAESRDARSTGGQNESGVGELERELYPDGIMRPENREEPPQKPRRQRKEDARLFEPEKDLRDSPGRDGPRISFAGQEPEVQQREGGREPKGWWEEHDDAEHTCEGEKQEQDNQHREITREYPKEGVRPEIGRRDERDYRRNETSSINIERVSGYSEENEKQDDDGLEEIQRFSRRPEHHRSREGEVEDREKMYGSPRQDSPDTVRGKEREPGSRKGKHFHERHWGKEPRKRDTAESPRERDLDSKPEPYLERPNAVNVNSTRDARNSRMDTEDPRERGNDEREDMAGPSS